MAKQGSQEALNETREELALVLAERLRSGKIGQIEMDAEELDNTYQLYIAIWETLPDR